MLKNRNVCANCTHTTLNDSDFPCCECKHNPSSAEQNEMFIQSVSNISLDNKSTIKDSGERREFETGAVRDIQEGKGRCDLLPLDIIAENTGDQVLEWIAKFMGNHNERCLWNALDIFQYKAFPMGVVNTTQRIANTMLEVSKHFANGASKYGEYNWQKGIPIHCYIDSGVRHYLKWLRGDDDEPHDLAFIWNILCCMWTMKNKPEMNDLHTYTLEEVKKELDL